MGYMKFGSQHIIVLVIGVKASYHGMLCVCLNFFLIFYCPKFGGAYLYHFPSKLKNLKTCGCTIQWSTLYLETTDRMEAT
jgi:hypothetical protein